jgi:NADH dehydrogenase/NADH:ubiquinone oxidoreductase subunit G
MSDATVASTITVTIDGHQVAVPPGTTLYDAALRAGITIPVLCHSPKLQPVAVCRMCVVEVQGARVLQAACIRQAEDGMVVRTQSDAVQRSRAMLTELLMADYPQTASEHNGHAQRAMGKPDLLLDLAAQQGITAPRFPARPLAPGRDVSSAVIQVNHDACIMCDRCIRACCFARHPRETGRFAVPLLRGGV